MNCPFKLQHSIYFRAGPIHFTNIEGKCHNVTMGVPLQLSYYAMQDQSAGYNMVKGAKSVSRNHRNQSLGSLLYLKQLVLMTSYT